jgi:aminopeptidase N
VLPEEQATASTASEAVSPAVASYRLEAEYRARLHLDWGTRRVRLATDITVRNTSLEPVDRLELNSVAARLGSLEGLRTRVDDQPVRAKVIGQTIRVPLDPPLAVGATAALRLAFRARLRTDTAGRAYFFTQVGGVAQLYRVIPWLSRAIPFGRQGHGEPFLTTTSPRAEITLSSDRRLVWAATGERIRRSRGRSTFAARDVRDMVIIASPDYRTVRGVSRDGQTAILAHVRSADGRRWVSLARDELARYGKLTGVPYPYPTFRIAESAAGLPMEAPGLIWIPGSRRAADHAFLISHETAHQWWYGIVGNDQSTDAFADEAMADHFSRKAHLSIRGSRCRRDRLDRDIRDYSSACYYEVIYVQGAAFLESLRRDFGDDKFKRAVRNYTQANRFGLGSNVRLLEAFRTEMGDAVLPRFHARFPSLY